MKRLPLALLLATVALPLTTVAAHAQSAAPAPTLTAAKDGVEVTAGALKMNCVYCHFSVTKSPDPGLPAVGTCMGCHTVVGTAKPDVQKLAGFWNRKEPIPWVRIHKLPEYVHFPHMRHVNGGVSCQTCHGDVQNMKQVYQANSLNMGWCINCHVGRSNPPLKARYDCATCHY